jgi:hypothetical protein
MKVFKHFLYIQYGGGKQAVVVYSLNHDIMAAFELYANSHAHISYVNQPDLDMMCISPRVHPYGIPTSYEGAETLFTQLIWKWTAVSNCLRLPPLHPDTIGLCLTSISNLPILNPDFDICNSPMVHPYGVPTAFEGAKNLFIQPIWKQKALSGGLQPQGRHHGSI